VRPWAGSRLGAPDDRIGELWLAGPELRVATDDGERTLDDIAATHGEALVGSRGLARLGPRFPLIVKLIDAADWLSLQVHPDDALARDLYGDDALGKAEAWLVLAADDGAELVTGPADDLTAKALVTAIRAGDADHVHCRRSDAVAGDTLLLRAGTLHAIGAGTFVYEIEQPSDLTFRVSDWGRQPARELHVDEALRAIRPDLHAEPAGSGFRLDGGALTVPEFRLELPDLASPVERRPGGETLEVVTALRGTLRLKGEGWAETVTPFGTVVVPASVDRYVVTGDADAIAAVGSIP
jgi:mannose-6-phosphate isomerase